RRQKIDLYHEQNYVPLGYDVPVVITIHDLSWLHYPETHPADRVRWLARGLPKALERAGAIMVDSNFVRTEVIENFGVAPARVHIAHLGVSRVYRRRTAAETAGAHGGGSQMHGLGSWSLHHHGGHERAAEEHPACARSLCPDSRGDLR